MAAKDSKAVFGSGDGGKIFVQCIDGRERAAFLARNGCGDIRVLDYEMNALDQPERSLKGVARCCREVSAKRSLPGPRTSQWCINYLAVENLGFEGHHERLRQICKVDTTAGEIFRFPWLFVRHCWWTSLMVAIFSALRFSFGGCKL